ncbi:MAG: SpoIIE family protein phosphatase [Melioribacteraceae bacterium]
MIKIIDEKSGLQTNVCFNIFNDKNGGLWLTTEYGINHIIEPSSLSSFQNSGELKNITNSIYRFNNRIYAATQLGPMILKSNNGGFQLLKGSNQPSYVFAEFNDKLLIGTGSGTFVIENRSITKRIINGTTTSILVSDYYPDRIYIGTYYGFSVLEKKGDKFKVVYEKNLPDEVINIIEEDGSLWINGFFPGLISVTGNLNELSSGSDKNITYESFNNSNGLAGNVLSIGKIDDTCFFNTNEGVYSYDKMAKTFKKFSLFGEVLSDTTKEVSLIANGRNKSIWILAYLQGEPVMGTASLQPDGNYNWKPIPELSLLDLSAVVSIYPDKDPLTGNEKLWLNTEEGLVLYDPSIEPNTLSNYSTLIRKVATKRDSIIYFGANNFEVDGTMEIAYSKNDMIFEYSTTHYDKPNSTYFKTFLEGDEEEWSSWGLETKKEYTNLSHGDYVFKLKAKNLYGIESDLASYSFTVLAPWYFSWWAYILYTFFIGGTLFSIRKFELNRRDKDNRIRVSELKAETAELQAKAVEAQARVMQAENERKSQELEEARKLQLSMLPKKLPELPNLEIAVYMKTATEVGGDYYDFHVGMDGTLTAVIGDATGHGLNAGTVVTATKSLFNTHANNPDILFTFSEMNRVLKGMKLRMLSMCLNILKIKGNQLTISSAGIPPALIYRSTTNEIEEFLIKGMPLGVMNGFPYELRTTEVLSGDIILLMSDGFPELQNGRKELFGYVNVKNVFSEVTEKEPEEIIEHLKNTGSAWVEDAVPDDDVTFVVIKIK